MTSTEKAAQANEDWNRTVKAFGSMIERITPWLLELGSWIFGALIAFSLLILGSLLTVGPTDNAVLIATAAFALALPADVAGFVLLRLVDDLKKVRLEEAAVKSFEEAGFPVPDDERADAIEQAMQGRTRVVLVICYSILLVSVLLTLTGISAALWHMAWWIAVVFIAMTVVSLGLVMLSLAGSPSGRRRSQA